MPIDSQIPLGVKPPNVTGRLSDLLDIQRKSVDIKRAQAETQGAQQSQQQRAALAAFDVGKIIDPKTGMIDLNKIPDSGLREAAGDAYPEQVAKYANVLQGQLQTQQGLVNLRGEQRQAVSSMIAAMRSDPDVANDTDEGRRKIGETLAQAREIYGPDAEPVLRAYLTPLLNAPRGKLAQVAQNLQLQAVAAGELASKQAPQYTPTGGTLKQTNPLAQQGQAPSSIPLTIAPGEQSFILTDQLGNQFEGRRDKAGNIIGARSLGARSDEGPSKGPASFGVGERAALEQQANANFENVTRNRQAASLAPQQLDQIRKAKELSKQVDTGKWSAQRAGIESGLSSLIPGLSAAESDATKLQELDKFLERISSDATKVLGTSANTDAARESISRQNASIGYTPKAIQAVLDYAEAQTMAMQAKGDAQEKFLKKEGNGITKQHEFETAWRQAYDPVAFQLEVATPDERKTIVNKLTKAQAAELKSRREKLRDLGALK